MHLAVFSICYRAVFIASEVLQFLTVCSVVATLVFLRGFSFNVIFFNGIECVFLVELSRDLSPREIWLLFTPCSFAVIGNAFCSLQDFRRRPHSSYCSAPSTLEAIHLTAILEKWFPLYGADNNAIDAPLKCSLPPSYQIAHALTKYFVQKSIRPA